MIKRQKAKKIHKFFFSESTKKGKKPKEKLKSYFYGLVKKNLKKKYLCLILEFAYYSSLIKNFSKKIIKKKTTDAPLPPNKSPLPSPPLPSSPINFLRFRIFAAGTYSLVSGPSFCASIIFLAFRRPINLTYYPVLKN